MSVKKTVIITGGSYGIGASCVNKFISEGYEVINIDLNPSEHGLGTFIQADLSKWSDIERAFDKIRQTHSHIDVLVSNAGIHVSATIEQADEALFDQVVNTNLKSCFFVIQKALPLMKEKGGHIITLGSDQSFVGKSSSAIYGLTKAAIAQLTKNIALDYARYGITANCVCPGTVATPLYWKAIQAYSERSGRNLDEIHKEEGRLQPAGRVGEPDEVAELIFFLAEHNKGFIQGASIPIDGGYTAQ